MLDTPNYGAIMLNPNSVANSISSNCNNISIERPLHLRVRGVDQKA